MSRFAFVGLFLLIAVSIPISNAQTTSTITVSTNSTAIVANSSGYFGVLYENAATPTATFLVTPGSSGIPVNVSMGAAYVFSRPAGSPFNSGDILGYVAASTPGPYLFVLVQYQNPPAAPRVSAVKCPTGQSVNQINPDGTTVCASQSPVSQWNSTVDAVTFTAQGTWSAPVIFTNSNPEAQSIQAATEFLENTDGQFEIVTYTNGSAQAVLNLDTDGHIDLFGSNGGGISTDKTGNTCLASVNGSCWNVVFANNGPLVNYQGVALKAGHGMPVILYGGSAMLTGDFGPFTLYTTPSGGYTSSGLFRVSGYVVATSPAPGATLQVRLNYRDDSGPNSQDTGTPVSFANSGTKLPFSILLQSSASQPITISVSTTNAPVYTIYATVEAL